MAFPYGPYGGALLGKGLTAPKAPRAVLHKLGNLHAALAAQKNKQAQLFHASGKPVLGLVTLKSAQKSLTKSLVAHAAAERPLVRSSLLKTPGLAATLFKK
jgi:hypothetical protein